MSQKAVSGRLFAASKTSAPSVPSELVHLLYKMRTRSPPVPSKAVPSLLVFHHPLVVPRRHRLPLTPVIPKTYLDLVVLLQHLHLLPLLFPRNALWLRNLYQHHRWRILFFPHESLPTQSHRNLPVSLSLIQSPFLHLTLKLRHPLLIQINNLSLGNHARARRRMRLNVTLPVFTA